MGHQNGKPNPIKLLWFIIGPLLLLGIYKLYISGAIAGIFEWLNAVAMDHRYILYPVLGAVTMIISSIRSIGWDKLKRSNHPIQGIIGAGLIGALGGLFIAWMLKLIFH